MNPPNTELLLFDDNVARAWEPFALTRPAGELLFGTSTFRARAERSLGLACVGHITAAHLIGFDEPGAPPVLPWTGRPTDHPRLFLSSRFLVSPDAARVNDLSGETELRASTGKVVGWYTPAGSEPPPPEFFLSGETRQTPAASVLLAGRIVEHVWDLISDNPEQLQRDLESLSSRLPRVGAPAGVFHWGEHPLYIDPTATVEPGSAFDTSAGPIWIDRDARVRAFTRLAGPAYIGPNSVLLGGAIEAVSIGPVCRVRGELAESVCLGYVNKQHDGHIGHAYLGRWVNLGAETTNSDLKNNYGSIRLWTPAGEVDTGKIKMGSLIGDHVKTGIGLLLNTGTVIGAGSNIYGSAMPPTYVPPFSWGSGSDLTEYRLDKFLEVAEKAMSRRDVALSSSMREQLHNSWTRGREQLGT